MGALLRLSWWQLKNALLSALRRPRLLIPMLILLALTPTQIGGIARGHLAAIPFPPQAVAVLSDSLPSVHTLLFVLLALFALAALDGGFRGGAFRFSLPDIDYLFPSPLPGRLLVALKMVGATRQIFSVGAIFAYLYYLIIWQPLVALPHNAPSLSGWIVLFAILLGFAGYANLALATELIFGSGRHRRVRKLLWAALGILGMGLGILIWIALSRMWKSVQHDEPLNDALLGRNPLLNALFYPCRLMADAAVDPLQGKNVVVSLLKLAGFYLATLGALLSLNVNFSEMALHSAEKMELSLEAVRRGDYSRLFPGLKHEKESSRLYLLRPFGQGAGALLWAHLSAAAKRPIFNFVLPVIAGLALGSLVHLRPEDTGGIDAILVLTGYYMFFMVFLVGGAFYHRALRRESLIRPLALPPWQVVGAEVLPRVLINSLPCWGLSLMFSISRNPEVQSDAPYFAVCLPLVLLGLNLINYLCVLFYSSPEDKLQQSVGGLIQLLMSVVYFSVLAPFLIVPNRLGFAPWATFFISVGGCLYTAALLFSFTVRAYAAYSPSGDYSSEEAADFAAARKSFWLPRWKRPPKEGIAARMPALRLPDLDEGLLLFTGHLWLTGYGLVLLLWHYPSLSHVNFLLLLAGAEAFLFVFPALLFVGIFRFDARKVFSWRKPLMKSLIGAAMMGVGCLPWIIALQAALNHFWPYDLHLAQARLMPFMESIRQHPVLSALVIGMAAGISEELFFRGPLQAAFLRRLPTGLALLAGGFLFAAVHWDAHGLLFRTLLGMALGWVVLQTGSIFPAMLMHGVIDAVYFGYIAFLLQRFGKDGFLNLSAKPVESAASPLTLATLLVFGGLLMWVGTMLCRKDSRRETLGGCQ